MRSTRFTGLLAMTLALAASAATPSAAAAQKPLRSLKPALEQRIARHAGKVGLAVVDLETGDTLQIRGDEPFPTASVVKVPILVELFHRVALGDFTLDDPLVMLDGDRVPGSGVLRFLDAPHRLTLRDAATLMIIVSDNTATNLVLDKLGLRAVNARMDTLGLPGTAIFAEVFRRSSTTISPDSSELFGLGVTTPMDMARIFARLHAGELVSPEASREMLGILGRQFSGDRIPRFLPAGAHVAHKTGEVNASRHDCGVVDTETSDYVLCILTTANEDESWRLDNEALLLGADLARMVHEHLVGPEPRP